MNLRTLTLTMCKNLSFIFTLNPNLNASNTVVRPKLEKPVLYTEEPCIDELLETAKEWGSRGARLSTVVIVCLRELISTEKVFDLRSYVSHVERRLDSMMGHPSLRGC